jgi:hypothetical protein
MQLANRRWAINLLSGLVAAVVPACVIGDTLEVPPLDRTGILTAPRHGAAQPAGDVTVDGYTSEPGATVVVERWDAASGAWVTASAAVTTTAGAGDPGAPMYAFHAAVAVGAGWPAGGLLSLRARVADVVLASLDAEPETQHCIDAHTTWRDRLASCASGFPTVTLVDAAARPPELAHRFLDTKGAGTPADTAAYYQAIGAPATLAQFLATYGLDDPATPTLTYYNLGDLATGREIRCKTRATAAGTGAACTTFNYGPFGSAAADALDLAVSGRIAGGGKGAFANVSMVYDPPITAPNAVKFMVFNAAGALLTSAQLDTRGDNTSIPNNCINCHGSDGRYDAATHSVIGARFLPFDPSAFVFSDRPGMTRGDQEAAMRALNQAFLAAAPSDALAETVRGWYGGGAALTGAADPSVVPAAWQGPATAPTYRNVIATACRGCHASRSDALAFATPDQLRARAADIVQAICGAGNAAHAMPSAEASLARFWSGPARAYLAGFLGPEVVGACPPPAPAP